MIIDSSGEVRKVWKSEVIGPAVIVDIGSDPHVGSFSWRHGQQTIKLHKDLFC